MDKAKWAGVTTAIGVIAAILGLWPQLSKVLAELPSIVSALTSGQLLGVGSFLLSVLFGAGAWSVTFLHPSVCKYRPHTCADLTAVVTGLAVNVVQQWLNDPTPRQLAWAILLGLFAGMVAMLSSRVVWSFFAKPKEQP